MPKIKKFKKRILIGLAGIILIIGLFFISSQGGEGLEKIDYDANVKTHTFENITITSPAVISCRWTDPNADWKLCEVVMAITNKDVIHDFIEKDLPLAKFKHLVTDMMVYTSPLSHTYQEAVLNSTCYKEIMGEDNDTNKILYDDVCKYNVTRYSFNDWKLKTKVDKFPKDNTLGIKLIFKSPIIIEEGQYLKNQFNFSLFGDYNVTLDPDISACGTLDVEGATYNLTADISNIIGSCFIITNNSITLDMKEHTITGHAVQASPYGVQVDGQTGVVIKNGTIDNFDSGIYFSSTSSSTIEYITSQNCDAYGIYLQLSSNTNNLFNNTLTSNTVDGIVLYSGSKDNVLRDNLAHSNSRHGIIIHTDSDRNTLSGNNFSNNNDYGIFLYGNCNNNSMTSNLLNSNSMGVNLESSSNNTIISSTINSNTNHGIMVYSASRDNEIKHNIINSNTLNGIYLYVNADSNTLTNNTLNNNQNGVSFYDSSDSNTLTNNTLNNNQGGITFYLNSDNNLLEGITLYNNTDDAIGLTGSDNNQFKDIDLNTVYDSSNDGSIWINTSSNNLFETSNFTTNMSLIIGIYQSSTNNTFLNCSYNTSKESVASGSELIRKWFFSAQVNNSIGGPINQSNVTAYNISKISVFSTLTDSLGQIVAQKLIEYINTQTRTYHTPHIINTSKTGFTTNSTTYNLTIENNVYHVVTLSDSNPPTVIIDHPKSQAYSFNTSLPLNYTITDSETSVDSCWYKVINSTSDLIISNTTIANCLNTTFNISQGTGTYNLTLYSNDSEDNLGLDSIEFSISLQAPAVVLDAPIDNEWLNNKTVYFNFTATDVDGLDTCELWGNWTETWHKNYTWVNPESGVMNYTILNISDSKGNIWNMWCNDTLNSGAWALNNFTFSVDTISPNLTISSPSGSYSISTPPINIISNDTNLDSCYYNVTTQTNLGVEIVSFRKIANCQNATMPPISDGSYYIFVSVNDSAGNINRSNSSFSISTGNGGGGGGGSTTTIIEGEEKTFCGDGTCQKPNDYGIIEDWWTCPSDCPGFNLDDLFKALFSSCFDEDPSTICFWNQQLFSTVPMGQNVTVKEFSGRVNLDTLILNCVKGGECFWDTSVGAVSLFILATGILVLFIVKVPIDKKKVSIPKYFRIKIKKKKWRKR